MSPRGSIDNSRFLRFNHPLDQCLLLIRLMVKCLYSEPDVGSIKTLHDDLRIAHLEPFHNLLTNSRCSCGSESQDGWPPNLLNDGTEAQVFWSETISPFADAVRFINDKQRRMRCLQAGKH